MSNLSQKFKGKYRIASTRLKDWDYRTPGYYFAALCTRNRVPWLGEVHKGKMLLSIIGDIAVKNLDRIPKISPNISLDAWVVMPNHIHAIIIIGEMPNVDVKTSRAVVETPHWGISTNEPKWRSGT
jgi:putative transposase